VAGVPWGHAEWSGAHAHLSTSQRIGSAAAIVVWTAAALIVLGRGGFWGPGRLASLFRWGTWFFVVLSAIGAVLNFASQSIWENDIFGPLALLLAVLCTLVARKAADGAEHEVGRLLPFSLNDTILRRGCRPAALVVEKPPAARSLHSPRDGERPRTLVRLYPSSRKRKYKPETATQVHQ
jgi:hypothetical protein